MNKYSLHRYLQAKVLQQCALLPVHFSGTGEWQEYKKGLRSWLEENLPVIRNPHTGSGISTGIFMISDSVSLETADVQVDENLTVPVYIYRPSAPVPSPAVMICPGFATPANTGFYVSFAISLAEAGITAAVMEYGGTGLCADRPVCETNVNNIASAAHLLGMNEAGFRVSYNISVFEYLRKDPGIIKDKIGITGLCQGAIAAMYTIAAEDGFASFAPLCGVSTYEAEVTDYAGRQGGWTGISPFVFNVLKHGDFMHFLAAFAPKPMLALNNIIDIHWPLQGFGKTRKFVSHIYDLYGAGDECTFLLSHSPHSYEGENATALVDFFIRTLGVKYD
ncbi:MAG: hypothetical protein JXB33_09310 [Clostridia bacterium]|nr:hypothetical protein [Clostridia bacterium]